MQRTTFPESEIAWKKEVERLLQDLRVGQSRLDQLIGPAQSQGVVIGGNPPDNLQCMRFEFTVETQAVDCMGCVSECKTAHISDDILAIKTGDSEPSVVVPAGDYLLTRHGLVGACQWQYGPDPIDQEEGEFCINFQTTPGSSGGNTALVIQHADVPGTLSYATSTEDPDCETIPFDSDDGVYDDWPEEVTITSHDCADEGDVPDDCDSGVDVLAEIKWDDGAFRWIQSIFRINGVDGGGSIEATFNGATFTLDITLNESFCYAGISATYHAPLYLDDQCRPAIFRRATAAAAWPTTISGSCVNCTPLTTAPPTTTPPPSTTTGEPTTTTPGPTTTTGAPTTSTPPPTLPPISTTTTGEPATTTGSPSTTTSGPTTSTGAPSTTTTAAECGSFICHYVCVEGVLQHGTNECPVGCDCLAYSLAGQACSPDGPSEIQTICAETT